MERHFFISEKAGSSSAINKPFITRSVTAALFCNSLNLSLKKASDQIKSALSSVVFIVLHVDCVYFLVMMFVFFILGLFSDLDLHHCTLFVFRAVFSTFSLTVLSYCMSNCM